jgi:hypothetical protein
VPDPDELYGRCESEMSPVNVSESGLIAGGVYTNDLYSYTIPACTVEAPDDG